MPEATTKTDEPVETATTSGSSPDVISDPMSDYDYLAGIEDNVGHEKLEQVRDTDTLADTSKKDLFFKEVAERHRQDPNTGLHKTMSNLVFKNNNYQAQGQLIPSTAIEKVGGNRRVAHMGAVYKYNLTKAFKQAIDEQAATDGRTPGAVLGEQLGERSQEGEAAVREVLTGQIAAGTGTAWWSAADESGAVDLSRLKQQLALEEDQYADGAVRFNLDAETAAGRLRKPTPFDGMGFKKWAPTEGGEWGLTGGGLKEAIAEGIPVSAAQSIDVLTD